MHELAPCVLYQTDINWLVFPATSHGAPHSFTLAVSSCQMTKASLFKPIVQEILTTDMQVYRSLLVSLLLANSAVAGGLTPGHTLERR